MVIFHFGKFYSFFLEALRYHVIFLTRDLQLILISFFTFSNVFHPPIMLNWFCTFSNLYSSVFFRQWDASFVLSNNVALNSSWLRRTLLFWIQTRTMGCTAPSYERKMKVGKRPSIKKTFTNYLYVYMKDIFKGWEIVWNAVMKLERSANR